MSSSFNQQNDDVYIRARNMNGVDLTTELMGGLAHGTSRLVKGTANYLLGPEKRSSKSVLDDMNYKLGGMERCKEIEINQLQTEICEMDKGIRNMARSGRYTKMEIETEGRNLMMKKQKLNKLYADQKKIYSNRLKLDKLEEMGESRQYMNITRSIARASAAPVKNGALQRQIRETSEDLMHSKNAEQQINDLLEQELLGDDAYEMEEQDDPVMQATSNYVKNVMTECILDSIVPSNIPQIPLNPQINSLTMDPEDVMLDAQLQNLKQVN